MNYNCLIWKKNFFFSDFPKLTGKDRFDVSIYFRSDLRKDGEYLMQT